MKLAHDQHVDWVSVVRDLIAAGQTFASIASRTGAQKDRVKKWVQIECQPRHDDGERLIELWIVVTRRARDSLPIVSRYA